MKEKIGRRSITLLACSRRVGSTSSRSFSLTNSYENIRFDFYYRVGGVRVCRLPGPEEGKRTEHDCCHYHAWHVDHEEELDHQEVLDRFRGGVACEEEDNHHEERGSFAFTGRFRIGFTFANSLI